MGCFFACFGSSKDAKRLKNKNNHNSRHTDQRSNIQRNAIPKPGQSSSVHTFPDDSNNKSLHPVLEAGNKLDGSMNISTTEEVTSVKLHEQVEVVLLHEDAASVHEKKQDTKEDNSEKSSELESSSEDFAVPLSPNFRSSCSPIHRYMNCKESDDEAEVFDDHLVSDENIDEFGMVESKKEISPVADSSMYVSELNPKNVRHRTAYVCPVLNPVENLSQWNAVKSKEALLPSTPEKENMESKQESAVEEFSYSSKSREPCVDASLSNWLASSEATPVSKITTTMTLEATMTPVRRSTMQGSNSLRRSGDSEMPVVGTVGTYWRPRVCDEDRDSASSFKGIPNTTSKYREDKTVNWHSTPFETRLERALNNRGVAKA